MSSENSELAARLVDVFNEGDVESVLAVMHPEVEFIPRRAPIQGGYHGHSGIRTFFADNEENFDVFHLTPEELHDFGDRLIGIGTLRVRGKGSGAEATVATAVVLTFEDGKIIRFEDFGDRASAFEAAGVPLPR